MICEISPSRVQLNSARDLARQSYRWPQHSLGYTILYLGSHDIDDHRCGRTIMNTRVRCKPEHHHVDQTYVRVNLFMCVAHGRPWPRNPVPSSTAAKLAPLQGPLLVLHPITCSITAEYLRHQIGNAGVARPTNSNACSGLHGSLYLYSSDTIVRQTQT